MMASQKRTLIDTTPTQGQSRSHPRISHRLSKPAASPVDFSEPEFECFSKLPVEIRLKIWGFAAQKALIKAERYLDTPNTFFYRRTPPAILQVCRESRYEMLYEKGVVKDHPTYELCSDMSDLVSDSKVYISMDLDTVMVATDGCIYSKDMRRIHHLAVSRDNFGNLIGCLPWFRQLESVTVTEDVRHLLPWGGALLPEVNGEINTTKFSNFVREWLSHRSQQVQDWLCVKEARNLQWKRPLVRYRAVEQFEADFLF